MQKGHNFDLKKTTFITIQPNPSYDMLLMSSQRSLMPKKEKVTEAFLRLALPPLKVDADDDGQVGILKAPLPDGTAELKMEIASNEKKTWNGWRFSKILRKYKHPINIKNYTIQHNILISPIPSLVWQEIITIGNQLWWVASQVPHELESSSQIQRH